MSALMGPETESGLAGEPEFGYQGVAVQNMFSVVWTLLGVSMVAMAFHSVMQREDGAWLGVLMGLFVASSGIFTITSWFKRTREIVVTNDGVAALAFGRTWRFIQWTEIARIVRIRRPMATGWYTRRDGYEFVIRGSQNEEIWFVDNITCLAALLSLLNRYIEQYHIPLAAFDRGSDTRPKIRAATYDPAERKRLLREGYQTSLSSLTTT